MVLPCFQAAQLPACFPKSFNVTQTYNLRRIARSVIALALLDYAKAHKTLIDPKSSVAAKKRSVSIQQGVSDFFEDVDDPLFGFAEMDPQRLRERFLKLKSDPESLCHVAKLKYAD